jgi:hypothetical protein
MPQLHIIVRHPRDPLPPPWMNLWNDPNSSYPYKLRSIETKAFLVRLCKQAMDQGEPVAIHRTRLKGTEPRTICSTAYIKAVDVANRKVVFYKHKKVAAVPPNKARPGQICYFG